MTRLLIGLMLSVYILLLGGYSHTCHQSASFSPGKYFLNLTANEFPDNTHCDEDQFRNPTPPDAREAYEKVKGLEAQEDEDTQSFRKQHLLFRLILTSFFADANRLTAVHPEEPLPFCPHFSYASPAQFIVQRVIRI
ncbi:hypothetical protein WJU16_09590 [Chitinophaga pollutisoli]|uniref:Secreted protein n=1 Tax=Chitinophaga pollutisoli TaxID=3133966 RepID=A0ABZ2YVE5_9BACT